ncbi:MAG: GAF domain-containing protein [Clostridia bacterium]|nr:GAF domain-containing protein [Clostridia bacterium]
MADMDYELLRAQLNGLAEADRHWVPLLSNAAALIYHAMPDLNWAGFYLMRGDMLTLGPFQGRVACVHIPVGRGVCGTAVRDDATQRVPDVHAFPGHIACDSASRSEIVIPLHQDGRVIGVLDIDSPLPDRFSRQDQEGLEAFAHALEELLEF